MGTSIRIAGPKAYLGFVTLATLGTRERPLVGVDTPVAPHMSNGLIKLPTVSTTEATLVHMHLLVLLEQVGFGEGLATLCAGEWPRP